MGVKLYMGEGDEKTTRERHMEGKSEDEGRRDAGPFDGTADFQETSLATPNAEPAHLRLMAAVEVEAAINAHAGRAARCSLFFCL